METRIKDIETSLQGLQTEIKVMNKTMSAISETLSEFKEINKKLHDIEIRLATGGKDMETLEKYAGDYNDFKKKTDDRLNTLEQKTSVSSVKVGIGERLVWIVITALIGLSAIFVEKR